MDVNNLNIKDLVSWRNKLIGRKIVNIGFLDEESAKENMWYKRPVVIELDDGTQLIPQSDDEGNDGGAIGLLATDSFDIMYVI